MRGYMLVDVVLALAAISLAFTTWSSIQVSRRLKEIAPGGSEESPAKHQTYSLSHTPSVAGGESTLARTTKSAHLGGASQTSGDRAHSEGIFGQNAARQQPVMTLPHVIAPA